ncbi:type II secretion system GspH family protein [Patescibacteria group bacterium]|nr:type II secretion system GspH family protein [Patescibacteria group bacterium]MBU4367329.1 type II secretion system GspH family protein [Patescibacteria group bacterium]MBU4461666.1 type II secretion system GspH family protein [Patescibacteria group bacterium]MCG2699717.1 type II secretion system GspH family protein [Candidatus Parcubacteria bacterium]
MKIKQSKINKQSKYYFSHNIIKKGEGFTLIELIVVASIFSLVLFTATDLFISIFQQQRRTLNQQELLNQTSYAVEYISRAIRMAKKDDSGFCLGTPNISYALTRENTGVKFINHSNSDICQEFFWDSLTKELKESRYGGTPLSLISDHLQVNYLSIELSGESGDDDLQPRVTISMEIQVKGTGEQPKKQIQTTISQRNLDVQ